jgi:hypothetical protein
VGGSPSFGGSKRGLSLFLSLPGGRTPKPAIAVRIRREGRVAPGGRSLEEAGFPFEHLDPHCRWKEGRRESGWLRAARFFGTFWK